LSRGASGLALAGPIGWSHARCSAAASGRVMCTPCHALADTGPLLCHSAWLRAEPSRCRGHRCGVNASPPRPRFACPDRLLCLRRCRCGMVVWPRPMWRGDAAMLGLPPLAITGEPRSGSALHSCVSCQAPISSPVCPGLFTANDCRRSVLSCPKRSHVHCPAAPCVEPSSLLSPPFSQFGPHSLFLHASLWLRKITRHLVPPQGRSCSGDQQFGEMLATSPEHRCNL
jgi:hypothetical protein